jgi:hypothetical protein
VWEEAVYLAYYLHWSLGEILDLPHQIRAQVIEQVGTINVRVSGGMAPVAVAAPVEMPFPAGIPFGGIPLAMGRDRETE